MPVPASSEPFEGSPNLYDLTTSNTAVYADTQAWADAVLYWNTTRGITLEDSGTNKDLVFDYFLDYMGNLFAADGSPVESEEKMASLAEAKRGAYLGRGTDETGLTKEAKETFEALLGTGIGGKRGTILETGLGWLRVRTSPGLGGVEIAKVDVGNEYAVLEEQTGWVKIRVDEKTEGWVSATYISVTE